MPDPALDELVLEGSPVVRLYHAALGRDPVVVELAQARRLVRRTGSLTSLAELLAAHPERSGPRVDAAALLERSSSPEFQATVSLLPGLLPGVPPDEPRAYALWMQLYDTPTPATLAAIARLDGPSIAIAMAVSDTEVEAALLSISSLRQQIHPHWTLHLATRLLSPWPRAVLSDTLADPRVVEIACADGDPLRTAIGAASADQDGLVAVLEPGDRLAPTALHEVVEAFIAVPLVRMVVTDEDVADPDGHRLLPRFKPAFSSVAGDAVGQLAVMRAPLLQAACEAPDRAFDDPLAAIASAAARAAGGRLLHLPAILCHRPRSRRDRTRAAPAHATAAPSAVTVIVLTRDRASLLAECAHGVLHRTRYDALDLLIVDNGSEEPDALSLLASLGGDRRVRVLRRPGPFNFARLNNEAAAEASGAMLVLLNNDVEVRDGGWLAELDRLAARPEIGVVGARLLYPDDTIQHAGLLLGPAGSATHVGRHFPVTEAGYLDRYDRVNELSAVTGACLAIRREVWHRVDGMDERLAVTFNDVDLCLRVRAAGLSVVWTPHATLTHREAQTRGREADDEAARIRFESERAILLSRWGEAVDADPFLNSNLLASSSGHLVATRPRHRRPWVS